MGFEERDGPAWPQIPGIHLGSGSAVRELRRHLLAAAAVRSTVLLLGPTGSGKEVAARLIHDASSRRAKPLVTLDCSSQCETLFDDAVFGHVRGAYSGADQDRLGVLEEAADGTLFIDEIGDLSPKLQLKLLRVLEDRTFRRLGGSSVVPFRARVIAATHRDLRSLVAKGAFREDLYFRLDVLQIQVPGLRDRIEDLPALAKIFLERTLDHPRQSAPDLSPELLRIFLAYGWPGNLRELAHACERLVVLSHGGPLRVRDLPALILESVEGRGRPTGITPPVGAREVLTRERLLQVLADTDGNVASSARQVGRSRTQLYRLLRKYRIDVRSHIQSGPQ